MSENNLSENNVSETSTVSAADLGSLGKIIRSVPKACLVPIPARSFWYVVRDFTFFFSLAYLVIMADSWILGLPFSILLGFAIGGLFVVGHDCGHRSFSKSEKINNIVGNIVTSPSIWPFHIWRHSHDTHHRHTNHIDRDIAWRPVTYSMWKRMPRLQKAIYLWTRRELFFLGSIYTTYQNIKDAKKMLASKRYSDVEKNQIKSSLRVTFAVTLVYIAASIYFGGVYGLVYMFLIPQLVFQALLSTSTYLHHTHPDTTFLGRKEWKSEKAQLLGSRHIKYPKLFEYMCHDINWHVPHHVCVGIPHYHLREAHHALVNKYGDLIQQDTLNLSLLRKVTSKCHFIKSKHPLDLSWSSYKEEKAEELKQAKAGSAKSDYSHTEQMA